MEMKKTSSVFFSAIKICAAVIILVIVFNFFFERASRSLNKESIEDLIVSLEETIESSKKINDDFEYPIQRRAAAEYTIVETSEESSGNQRYIFICAVSKAIGQTQRAQTIVNIGVDNQANFPMKKLAIYLASDKSLCSETEVIGTGFYVPTSDGWTHISKGKWTWLIRTSNVKVTSEQIEATLLRIKYQAEFKEKFGIYDYSEKLESFIEKELGREIEYTAAGVWNDDFVKR